MRLQAKLPVASGRCYTPCSELPRFEAAERSLLAAPVLNDLSAFFKVLGDPMRLHIVHLLGRAELCVCDLSALLGAGQSTVSNHLRVLRAHRLVRTRKEGKLIFYSLVAPDLPALVARQLEAIAPAAEPSR